ncbi:MAG: peptide deformylase [Chloroflexi bacterium]|nr:peptide deformylase [Chloroflexota bacterium]
MTLLEIITPANPALRHKANPVERVKEPQLQQLIDQMIATMRHAHGVGLAAPQVAQPLRLVVIETPAEVDDDGEEIPDSRKLYTVINPQITWASRKMVLGIEGCLSIPGYLGEVARHQAIKVEALDRMGRKLSLSLKGWDARIFQHEIDHLDGILYTDRLTAPENFWSEEELRKQEEEEEKREQETKEVRE